MANVSFDQLFRPQSIMKVISQIREARGRMTNFFGMQPGGPGRMSVGGDGTSYDVFNRARDIAKIRPTDAGPATSPAQVAGNVQMAFVKAWDSIHINQSRIFRTRPLGKDWGQAQVDTRGMQYVTAQERIIAQRFANLLEFMVTRMCRGIFYIKYDGDDMVVTDTAGSNRSVDFQVPATSKSQLALGTGSDIIDASWLTASTKIVKHVMQINAAFEALHGHALEHIWLNSTLAPYILENTQVKDMGGTANTTFTDFSHEGQETAKDPGTVPDLGFTLRAVPWIRWHIYDSKLTVDGTSTLAIPNERIICLPAIGSDRFVFAEGSEIIVEQEDVQGSEQFGTHFYSYRTREPAGWDLKGWFKGLPVPFNPEYIAYGDVTP